MTAAKHTPGPWSAERWGVITSDVAGHRRQVAAVTGDATMHDPQDASAAEVRDANARLIAAAPALLEALEGMLAIVADSHGVAGYHRNDESAGWDEFDEVATARTAIAATRGES